MQLIYHAADGMSNGVRIEKREMLLYIIRYFLSGERLIAEEEFR